jgi:hypothetical protein
MIHLDIGKGYVATLSDEDAHLAQFVWRPMEARRDGVVVQVYVQRSVKFANGKWGASLLHREVMDAPKGMEVDHIDRNGLNCTRENLRLATVAENRRYARLRKDNGTGKKGVTQIKNGKFVAQIKASGRRGKSRYLGLFASADDAAHAYDRAARALHGEFAVLNYPNET